ncbi:hypothetical protein PT974_10976 [Cladobotryum mycophilum]|uniref:Uncharacterized protein n=1 Tax=Cladobotryum mycophilum TaxID=491253 RepID=A0ABR0SBB7_9HYPO
MVVSVVEQKPDTYLLWKTFYFPTEHGPRHAIAVKSSVADILNSTYANLLPRLMTNVWAIILSIVVFLIWRADRKQKPHPVLPTLWNNLGDIGSIAEALKYRNRKEHKQAWLFPLLLLIFAAWAAQTALNIVVPPLLILGNAAPVNPEAIYIPDLGESDTNLQAVTRFALETPWALRALGSADQANADLHDKVKFSLIPEGSSADGESILRLNYEYNVTGLDFGLQRYPHLHLYVTGSCVTEYTWHSATRIAPLGSALIALDDYVLFPNSIGQRVANVSLFDGPKPSAQFFTGNQLNGTLEKSNITWAAVVSSVNRTSFMEGNDPWYLTEFALTGVVGVDYRVKSARPALSCWEDTVWSYKGRNSTVGVLNSINLPGLDLPESMQTFFSRYLGSPMIQQLGSRVGLSALKSTTTALGQIFDAGSSSFQDDLERLLLASYIATVNILTDSTLYSANASSRVPNQARGDDGEPQPGIGSFVVWNADVSAVSLRILIVIPSLLAASWVLLNLLLYFTPLSLVNGLDAGNIHEYLQDTQSLAGAYATLSRDDKKRPTWTVVESGDQNPETSNVEYVAASPKKD